MQFHPHHYAIVASDYLTTKTFYELFGFREFKAWTAEDRSLTIGHLELDGIFLEVFAPQQVNSAPVAMSDLAVDLKTIGTKHFGLRVKDVRAAREWCESNVNATISEIKKGRTGITYFFINDPDGNWLEILQDDRDTS